MSLEAYTQTAEVISLFVNMSGLRRLSLVNSLVFGLVCEFKNFSMCGKKKRRGKEKGILGCLCK